MCCYLIIKICYNYTLHIITSDKQLLFDLMTQIRSSGQEEHTITAIETNGQLDTFRMDTSQFNDDILN